VHWQVYWSRLRNKNSVLIHGFSRAVCCAWVDAVAGTPAAALPSFEHGNRRGGWSTQARDRQPITVPVTAAHRARRLHLSGGLLATRRAAKRRAEAHAGGLWMVMFPGRRRHVSKQVFSGRRRRRHARAVSLDVSRRGLETTEGPGLTSSVRGRERRGSRVWLGGVVESCGFWS